MTPSEYINSLMECPECKAGVDTTLGLDADEDTGLDGYVQCIFTCEATIRFVPHSRIGRDRQAHWSHICGGERSLDVHCYPSGPVLPPYHELCLEQHPEAIKNGRRKEHDWEPHCSVCRRFLDEIRQCPMCLGERTIYEPEELTNTVCFQCNGKGWIPIQEEPAVKPPKEQP